MKTSQFAVSFATFILGIACISSAYADGSRFRQKNVNGGITAGANHSFAGRNGGTASNNRSLVTDGAGNAVSSRAGQVQTANGGFAARNGNNTRNADGSATHESSASASGAYGNLNTQGSASRAADGSVTQSRTTQATSASGNTYNGSTSYSKETGLTHTGTCTDAAGNSIPCKK